MKHLLIIVLSVLSLSTQAKPLHDQLTVLAMIQTTGGLIPNEMHRNLEVFSNGEVLLTQQNHPSRLIATLSAETLQGFERTIATAKEMELVRENDPSNGDNENEPHRCLDAPSTTWAVFQNTKMIVLQKMISCEKFKQNGPYAQELVQILDTFRMLVNL